MHNKKFTSYLIFEIPGKNSPSGLSHSLPKSAGHVGGAAAICIHIHYFITKHKLNKNPHKIMLQITNNSDKIFTTMLYKAIRERSNNKNLAFFISISQENRNPATSLKLVRGPSYSHNHNTKFWNKNNPILTLAPHKNQFLDN